MKQIMDLEHLVQILRDAGCREEELADITRTYESGDLNHALHLLKKSRCGLMDLLHETSRKVDCLDCLIRSTEKELRQKQVI